MREQKYANVLEEYEEKMEKEEKLSMTRELKYRELQEEIKKEEIKEIKKENSSKKIKESKNENVELNEEVSNKKTLKTKSNSEDNGTNKTQELKEISENDDDIYLTTSFKPPKLSFRLKKGVKKILYFLIFCSFVLMLLFFVGLPAYRKFMDSKPKMIFNGTIDFVSNKIVNVVEKTYSNSGDLSSDILFNFDSNITNLDSITNNKYGVEFNIDSTGKNHQTSIYTLDNDQKYGINYLYNNNVNYINYSTSDKYMKLKNSNDEYYGYLNEYFDYLSKIGKDDLVYFIETEGEIFKDIIENNLIKTEKDELNIGGKTLKVTKNSFELDEKNYERLYKKRNDFVLRDKVLLKVESALAHMSVEDYSKLLKKGLSNYNKLKINIYTINGTKVVGFDIEKDGFTNIYYYAYDDNFMFHINLASKIVIGKDSNSTQKVIDLVGKKENNDTNVTLKYNTKDIAKLKIEEFSNERISFDYEAEIKKNKYLGDSVFAINKDQKEVYVSFNVKSDEKFINLNVNFTESNADKKFNINSINIFNYTDKLYNDERIKFVGNLSSEDLKVGFSYWDNLLSNPKYLKSEFKNIVFEKMTQN